MSDRTCTIESCGGRIQARGWCSKHYDRWRKHGDPTKTVNRAHTDGPCELDDCSEPMYAKGWCKHHYNRNYHSGEPTDGVRRPRYKTPRESFVARTRWEGECLVWQGSKYPNGYGQIAVGHGKMQLVHRWAWEQQHGTIPSGMQIDHMCHNRACVNIEHLRLATPKQNLENMLRGNAGSTSGGIRGVCWDASRNKWLATVGHNGEVLDLGRYESKELAATAALGARLALFRFNLADRAILDMEE